MATSSPPPVAFAPAPSPSPSPAAAKRAAAAAEANKPPTLRVKNTMARPVHIGGVMLIPGQVGEVPDDEAGVNKRDVEGTEGLNIEKATAEEIAAEHSPETLDVLHPANVSATETGWMTPGAGARASTQALDAKATDEIAKANAETLNTKGQPAMGG